MTEFVQEIAFALEKIGLTTIILPFALTFVIMFSVLQKTKILGQTEDKKAKKRLNLIVSLAISFIVIAYADSVAVINRIAQYGVVLLIIGLLCVIVFTFSGFHKIGEHKLMKGLGLLVFIVFVFYVLGGFNLIEQSQIETKILIPVIGIATFIFMIYFIIKPKKEITEKKKTGKLPEIEEGEERTPREEFGD